MSAHEQTLVRKQLRERIEAVLSPSELADYDAYQQRLEASAEHHDSGPTQPTAEQQLVLDKLANDTQAAALHKQLMVLLRVETLPQ